MIYERIPLKVQGSLDNAYMQVYIKEQTPALRLQKYGLVLVIPGGGYGYTSDREAEPIAIRLLSMGYHAAVLRYSCEPAHFPVQLQEAAAAIHIIKENSEKWHVDMDHFITLGFSAGGHVAASYGVFWNRPELTGFNECIRPSMQVLCYPVITADEKNSHERSIRNLLGDQYGDPEVMDLVSLEKQVGPQVPPTFIWNTLGDQSVPPKNSYLFAGACMDHGVPVEYHLYENGRHGLALANDLTDDAEGLQIEKECQSWPDLLDAWLSYRK